MHKSNENKHYSASNAERPQPRWREETTAKVARRDHSQGGRRIVTILRAPASSRTNMLVTKSFDHNHTGGGGGGGWNCQNQSGTSQGQAGGEGWQAAGGTFQNTLKVCSRPGLTRRAGDVYQEMCHRLATEQRPPPLVLTFPVPGQHRACVLPPAPPKHRRARLPTPPCHRPTPHTCP